MIQNNKAELTQNFCLSVILCSSTVIISLANQNKGRIIYTRDIRIISGAAYGFSELKINNEPSKNTNESIK
ncbi:hypothetical protein [Epilithonimonas sp.]|uniref:hypothetical protein n=1 Tax=Epilithonimonas sp. TaxID=2894511 RepID=UPI002898F730|nr:hypothetical protein [Epilithonimonas sp.]